MTPCSVTTLYRNKLP